jgi:hypothetical protein
MLTQDGAIYLPLHPSIFIQVMKHEKLLAKSLSLDLLTLEEVKNLHLVKATDGIEPLAWRQHFSKKEEQQNALVVDADWLAKLRDGCPPTEGEVFKEACVRAFEGLRHNNGGDCLIAMKKLPMAFLECTGYVSAIIKKKR